MRWDEVNVQWEGVNVQWDEVNVQWDEVNVQWGEVNVQWGEMNVQWDEVNVQRHYLLLLHSLGTIVTLTKDSQVVTMEVLFSSEADDM